MFTSTDLKAIIEEARPVLERRLDDTAIIAGFRETVTAKGGDWSQVKALVTAMIQDDRDETGGNKRVRALLSKADHALGYADMLGLGNLNEKNSFADEVVGKSHNLPEHDAETGEITEPATHAADDGEGGGEDAPALSADTQSTAARKDVPGQLRMTPASDPQPEPQDRIGGLGNDPEVAILAAGTQAPPVDTNSEPGNGLEPIPTTTNGGSDDRSPRPEPEAVNLGRQGGEESGMLDSLPAANHNFTRIPVLGEVH